MNKIPNRQWQVLITCSFVILALAIPSCVTRTKPALVQGSDWELVRTVPNRFGGTIDFVVVTPDKMRDLGNYKEAAEKIVGTRDKCIINFWTNRAQIPTSAQIPVPKLQVMTASYERYPTYKAPVLRLACWLYPSLEAAKRANAFLCRESRCKN